MNSSIERYCPACNFKNEPGAMVCAFCHLPMDETISSQITTRRLSENGTPLSQAELEPHLNSLMPTRGLTIYVINNSELIIIPAQQTQITLGRKPDIATANPPDDSLVNIGANDIFVSRRHARIIRTGSGYDIMDLDSSNGTWIDNQRLIPQRPYPLKSGTQIRLGHIHAILHFSEP